jgi:uncharacterized membrane protein HdeD (DUF308 family)
MRHHLVTAVGAIMSTAGAITAWQEQVDWGLRVAASAVAIIAGMLAIHDWIKRREAKKKH